MSVTRWFNSYLGLTDSSVGHGERLISGLGGLCGIVGVMVISAWWLDGAAAMLIMGSMGSSAVLLFAVPHGPLSQPWPLVGGHMVSATVGVAAARWIPDLMLAAGLAVGVSITVMYYLRCIHPPGGATAMIAVIGGDGIHDLGWQFVFTPTLLNSLAILAIALAFNAPFPWRRYPRGLARRSVLPASTRPRHPAGDISHADLVYALSEMDTFLDVSENDLLRVYELATEHSRRDGIDPTDIRAGAFYSNGRYGEAWSVREVTAVGGGEDPAERAVSFRVVAGHGRRRDGEVGAAQFAAWAAYEVERDETSWRRADGAGPGSG
ncbi:MAG: HPP family protein [Gammaproteobacteria bacterium]|nr:HPP family protein [Gammaproteobacteria bacterium]